MQSVFLVLVLVLASTTGVVDAASSSSVLRTALRRHTQQAHQPSVADSYPSLSAASQPQIPAVLKPSIFGVRSESGSGSSRRIFKALSGSSSSLQDSGASLSIPDDESSTGQRQLDLTVHLTTKLHLPSEKFKALMRVMRPDIMDPAVAPVPSYIQALPAAADFGAVGRRGVVWCEVR